MNLKSYLITVFLILFVCLTVSAQVFKNSDLSITKLEDEMWVVETSDNTSMYIIEGTDKAMLIDTGTKCEKLDSIVKLITQKPLYVVITHMHPDHAGNMNQFGEIFFHAADTVLLSLVVPYKGKIHFVKDGDIFDLGRKKIEVSHMPAHTPGTIVLLDRKAGNCYAGDAFGSGQVWLQLRPSAPIKTYIKSCKKMEKLMNRGITNLYCGHYPHAKKAFDKSYITDMRKLAEALDKGTASAGNPYPVKVSIGGNNPMITTLRLANIVYDPEFLK